MSEAVVIHEEEALTFLRILTSEEANAAHRRIAGCLQDALGIGEFLTRQKEELGHGRYLPWFNKNMEFDQRTGNRYVKLYANREALPKNDTVSDLNLTEAYRIAGVLKEPKSKEPVVDATFEVVPAEKEDPYAVEPISLERGLDGQMYNVTGSDRDPKYTLLKEEPVKSWTPEHICDVDQSEPYTTPTRSQEEKTILRFNHFVSALSKESGETQSTIKQWILKSLN